MIYKNFYLENDNNIFILLLQKFLNCGTNDLYFISEYLDYMRQKNINILKILDYDLKNFDDVISVIFTILLEQFEVETNVKVNYDIITNFANSFIDFENGDIEDKFFNWLTK